MSVLSIVVICCPLILVPEQENTDYTVNLVHDAESDAFVQMEDEVEVPRRIPGSKPMSKPKPKAETIRSFFPETWIWELVSLG